MVLIDNPLWSCFLRYSTTTRCAYLNRRRTGVLAELRRKEGNLGSSSARLVVLTGGTKTSRAGVPASLWQGRYFTANSFSNSSFENLAPSSVSATDLALVAGFEM
jgi:hypothetical protein